MRVGINSPWDVRNLVEQLTKVSKNLRVVKSIGIITRERPRWLAKVKVLDKVEPKSHGQVVFSCHSKMHRFINKARGDGRRPSAGNHDVVFSGAVTLGVGECEALPMMKRSESGRGKELAHSSKFASLRTVLILGSVVMVADADTSLGPDGGIEIPQQQQRKVRRTLASGQSKLNFGPPSFADRLGSNIGRGMKNGNVKVQELRGMTNQDAARKVDKQNKVRLLEDKLVFATLAVRDFGDPELDGPTSNDSALCNAMHLRRGPCCRNRTAAFLDADDVVLSPRKRFTQHVEAAGGTRERDSTINTFVKASENIGRANLERNGGLAL